MEEQPIDNLFKRKLHDAEIKPSTKVWTDLEAKHKHKQIVPLWTYIAIAASIIVVGMFSWWAMQLQNSVASLKPTAVVVPTLSPTIAYQPNNRSAVKTNWPKMDKQPSGVGNETVKQKNLSQEYERGPEVSQKGSSRKAGTYSQPTDDIASKIEKSQLDVNPVIESTPVIAVIRETQKEKVVPIPERTLIVSIDAPDKVIPATVKLVAVGDSANHRKGLGNLLKTVRKLKEGDVFASNAGSAVKINRRGFSKFYDGVKESIQNNSDDQ